jgi:hypothetical protein
VSHFARTQLDATWTTGNYVTLVADWQSLGAKVFAAINGDLGGAWAPTSPIVLNGTLGVAAINFGTVLIDYGGSVTVGASATVLVSGVSGGWPVFVAGHAKQSRSIQHSWLERQATPLYHWANNIVAGGVQSIACTIQSASLVATVVQGQPLVGGIAHLAGTSRSLNELVSGSTSVDAPTFTSQSILQQPRMLLPLRVHDGARLTSATLTFGVSTPRQAGPIVAPRLRIFRADLSGNIVPLASIAAGADERGFLPIATPTNGPAWYANGAVQTFIYPCDQNNVVDVSQYLYFAELVEEVATLKPIAVTACDGVLVRERKADVDVASIGANIALTGTYTLDGVALAIGSDRPARERALLRARRVGVDAAAGSDHAAGLHAELPRPREERGGERGHDVGVRGSDERAVDHASLWYRHADHVSTPEAPREHLRRPGGGVRFDRGHALGMSQGQQ